MATSAGEQRKQEIRWVMAKRTEMKTQDRSKAMKGKAVTNNELIEFAGLIGCAIGSMVGGGVASRAQLSNQLKVSAGVYDGFSAMTSESKEVKPWAIELFKGIEERLQLEIDIIDERAADAVPLSPIEDRKPLSEIEELNRPYRKFGSKDESEN